MDAGSTTILAMVVTAGTTLYATHLTNRSHERRQKSELSQQSKQQAQERVDALRQDAYLQYFSEFQVFLALVPSLATDDDPIQKFQDQLRRIVRASAQVLLVSEAETTATVLRVGMRYSQQAETLLPMLQEIATLRKAVAQDTPRMQDLTRKTMTYLRTVTDGMALLQPDLVNLMSALRRDLGLKWHHVEFGDLVLATFRSNEALARATLERLSRSL